MHVAAFCTTQETIDTFQDILDAMMAGDASQNIVQCNTPDVVQARTDIKTAWLPYKAR